MIRPGQLILVPPNVTNIATGLYRVVIVLEKERLVALHRMDATTAAKPRTFELKPLLAAISPGGIETVPEPELPGPSNAFRAKALESAAFKTRSAVLTELTEAERLCLMVIYGRWGDECEKAAKKYSLDPITVARLLTTYFRQNFSIEKAAIGGTWACGRGKRKASSVKLGRPHKRVAAGHRPEPGRNATQEDQESIHAFYEALPDQSISEAEMWRQYERTWRPKTVELTATGRFEVVDDTHRAFISKSQFVYHLKQVTGALQLLTDAAGERRIQLSHRTALGSARDRIPYPGHTYVIDATLADVYLVSAFDRRLIIGRPVVYVVIDAFSSLIVGIHVALSGPGFDEARIAMYRAISDKRDWLEWLGLPDLHPLLPQGCRPSIWLADRGEMHSKASYKVAFEVQSILSLAAAYRADWKSIVERNFGTLNTGVIHWLPGAVNKRAKERGARDKRLDATLTLKEFTRVLVREVAALNMTRDMSKHLSASVLKAGMLANPIEFWKWGIENLHGSASFLTKEEAIRATLKAEPEAKLSRFGAFTGKLRYTADWMDQHPALQLAGLQGSLPIELFRSTDVPSQAYCFLPDESVARVVNLHSEFSYEESYLMEDVLEFQELKEFAGADLADDTADMRVALKRSVQDEIDVATTATRAAHKANPVSKSQRTKGIAANRESEIREQATALVPPPPGLSSGAEPPMAQAPRIGEVTTDHPQESETGEAGDDYYARMTSKLAAWRNP